MKNLLFALITLCAIACGETASSDQSQSDDNQSKTDVKPVKQTVSAADIAKYGFQKYEGAWFDVLYPDGFTIKESQADESNPEGYSSCFFISPDEAVSFYVFGPQWGGETLDIAFDPAKETIEVDDKKEINPMTSKRWITYAAKDGSYKRSYEETYSDHGAGQNISAVIGLKYKDKESYDLYKPLYQKFKESFIQYAD